MSDPAKSVSPADEGCVDIWQYGGSQSRHLVVFIPGNPGILEYYTEYLHLLHQHLADAQIVACSLDYRDMRTLDQQIGFKIHTVRRLVRARGRSRDGKAIVIGHSVGSYIACRVHEAEPLLVDTVVGLFPTVSHIAKSRAGMLMTVCLVIARLFLPAAAAVAHPCASCSCGSCGDRDAVCNSTLVAPAARLHAHAYARGSSHGGSAVDGPGCALGPLFGCDRDDGYQGAKRAILARPRT